MTYKKLNTIVVIIDEIINSIQKPQPSQVNKQSVFYDRLIISSNS